MYGNKLLVPMLKTTSNPARTSDHNCIILVRGNSSPNSTTQGRRIPWQFGQRGGESNPA